MASASTLAILQGIGVDRAPTLAEVDMLLASLPLQLGGQVVAMRDVLLEYRFVITLSEREAATSLSAHAEGAHSPNKDSDGHRK